MIAGYEVRCDEGPAVRLRSVLSAASVCLILGCSSSGTYFSWSSLDQLSEGMSQEEVQAIMGAPPDSVRQDGDVQVWVWCHKKTNLLGTETRLVKMPFEDGKLMDAPKRSDLDKRSGKPFQGYRAKQDRFNPNQEWYLSDPIYLRADDVAAFFEMHFYRVVPAGGEQWILRTVYSGSSWMFIRELKIDIDGRVFTFDTTANPKREVDTEVVVEVNQFEVSRRFMSILAGAENVAMRLSGDQYKIDKELASEDVGHIRWWIEDYILGQILEESTAQPSRN